MDGGDYAVYMHTCFETKDIQNDEAIEVKNNGEFLNP